MKIDLKLIVGAIGAGLAAAVVYVGNQLNLDAQVIAAVCAAIAWVVSWVNGRNNNV